MGYRHEVAFAIGGSQEKVEQLLQNFKAAARPDAVTDEFKLVTYDADLTLLAYYHPYTRWDEEEQLWHVLKRLADEAELSYILRRLGEDLEDVEWDTNDDEDYFDYRMEDLMCVRRDIQLDEILQRAFGVIPDAASINQ